MGGEFSGGQLMSNVAHDVNLMVAEVATGDDHACSHHWG